MSASNAGPLASGAEKTKAGAKPLLRVLHGQTCPTPPIWLMRQAGRYLPEYRQTRSKAKGFLDLCFTPELAIEVTLQPIRRFGFDGAILFSDILVIPHALGQRVWFEDGQGPLLDALDGSDDVARLCMDGFDAALSPVYRTVRGLSERLPKDTTLIGFAGAPWTVASYMVEGGSSKDFVKVKAWAFGEPASFQILIDLLVEATARYLGAQVEAGAEALQIFDSWAGVLPEPALRQWCLGPVTEIIRRVRTRHPDIPIILFPRGAGVLYKDYAREAGAQALSVDATVPIGWARQELQGHCTVQGNLDPVLLTTGGEALRENVREILEGLAAGPFVFNLGSGILPSANPDHVAELVDLVRAWNR